MISLGLVKYWTEDRGLHFEKKKKKKKALSSAIGQKTKCYWVDQAMLAKNDHCVSCKKRVDQFRTIQLKPLASGQKTKGHWD